MDLYSYYPGRPDMIMVLTGQNSDKNTSLTEEVGHYIYPMPQSGTSELIFEVHVPMLWDSTTDPTVTIVGFTDGTGTAKNYVFEIGVEATDLGAEGIIDGVDDDTNSFVQLAPNGNKAGLISDVQSLDRTTLDLANKKHMSLRIRRLGDDGSDNRSFDFRFLHIVLKFELRPFA